MANELSLIFYYTIFFSASYLAMWIAAKDVRENRSYLIKIKKGKLFLRNTQICKWILLIAIPVLAASFRYGIGTDYPSYKIIYTRVSQSDITNIASLTQPTEFISNILYKLAYWIFDDFQGWLFLASLITMLIGYLAIYNYKNTADIFLMCFSFMTLLYAPSFNIIRQIMAVSIVFLGIKYISERKPVKYFLVIIIAAMLHTSAIFAALFYFLNVKESKYAVFKQIGMFILCAAIPAVFSTLFEIFTSFSVFQAYGTNYSSQYGLLHISDILFRLPVAAVILIFRKKLEDNDSDSRLYELIFFMEFISLLLTAYNKWLYRLMYFCIPGEVILVSRLPKCFSKNSRFLITAGIVFYYMVFFYLNNYYRGVDQIFPYTTIFN